MIELALLAQAGDWISDGCSRIMIVTTRRFTFSLLADHKSRRMGQRKYISTSQTSIPLSPVTATFAVAVPAGSNLKTLNSPLNHSPPTLPGVTAA